MPNDYFNIKNAREWNRLGILYFSQGQWMEAIDAYQAAISEQADFVDAYYNLGLVYNKLTRYQEAIHAYQAVIELASCHVAARFQLACLYMRQESFSLAISHFLLIVNEPIFHFEVIANLATCYLGLGQLDDAKCYYMQAIELNPSDIQVLFNLGVLNMQQGRINDAIEFYLQTIKKPIDKNNIPTQELLATYYAAHNNLGVVYLAQKNREAALLHFREVLRIDPHNQAILHIVNIIENKEMITATPPDYVRSLFNSYANHYDVHLIQVLHYQVPRLMYQMIRAWVGVEKNQRHIVDLGCGTGLCGQSLISYAASLVGVDLSEEMLKLAAEKHIYHELIHADIVSFLQHSSGQYDLVVAGDVLSYFGNLDLLMSGILKVIKKDGLLIFSVEKGEQADYEMTASGRFIHHQQYIDKLIQEKQFMLLQSQEVTLRTQEDQPVLGYLYLLKKLF